MSKVQNLATKLLEAEQSRISIEPLVVTDSLLTVNEAYSIQLENINTKLIEGQKIVGKKIGLTSLSVQQMLGVDEPDYGHLLDSMIIENGETVSCDKLLQPKIEGEIAFVLKTDLVGPNITALDVLNATDYIVPAIEIVDSRIQDWNITLQDTVADNASAGLFVLGSKPTKIEDIDLELLGMVVYKNGEVINTGVGAAALGHPANCVAWLANRLADYNIFLKAGEIILSGALSGMVQVQAGDHFTVKFAHLGEVSVRFQ